MKRNGSGRDGEDLEVLRTGEDGLPPDLFSYLAIKSADGCLVLGAILFVIGLIPLAIRLIMR